jgi:hypothetical protein
MDPDLFFICPPLQYSLAPIYDIIARKLESLSIFTSERFWRRSAFIVTHFIPKKRKSDPLSFFKAQRLNF